MASHAEITIIGNLGREPELRMTPNGKAVCEFSVAVNRKGEQGEADTADWYRVSCWDKQAEVAQMYLHKGSAVYVRGDFAPRIYTAKDGAQRVSYDIKYPKFVMLDRRVDSGDRGERGDGWGDAAPRRPEAAQEQAPW